MKAMGLLQKNNSQLFEFYKIEQDLIEKELMKFRNELKTYVK